ncbi:MAG: RNA methyltransferase [Desulfovibrio sp.]|jgi:23S rRNA (guanosine2251-2'-O)-methyltransferase|nr:RNA methyltransferase [Desulfovibrio sp.]
MEDTAPVLPGVRPVLDLLAADPGRVDLVYCRKGLRNEDASRIQSLCRERGIRFVPADRELLDRLCRDAQAGDRKPVHQGVVARLVPTGFADLPEVLRSAASAPLPVLLVLDQVQDPGNVGTLCRTLFTLGGVGLLVPRHNGAYLGPAAHKASAGALERIRIAKVANLAQALDEAEEAGFNICGAVCRDGPGVSDAFRHPLPLPAALVLGNEERGIRPGVLKRCAVKLRIPSAGDFDSLNVAQAGAILLGLAAARLPHPGN